MSRASKVLAAAAVLLLALWLAWPQRRPEVRPAPAAATISAPPAPARSGSATRPRATAAASRDLAALAWGAQPGALGRSAAGESSPEGPMALAISARGDALVLDQVNGR